jgi:hypothetical protein
VASAAGVFAPWFLQTSCPFIGHLAYGCRLRLCALQRGRGWPWSGHYSLLQGSLTRLSLALGIQPFSHFHGRSLCTQLRGPGEALSASKKHEAAISKLPEAASPCPGSRVLRPYQFWVVALTVSLMSP